MPVSQLDRSKILPRVGRRDLRGRQDLRDLAERGEDHLLEDIGVTREDALRAAAKWFWQC